MIQSWKIVKFFVISKIATTATTPKDCQDEWEPINKNNIKKYGNNSII